MLKKNLTWKKVKELNRKPRGQRTERTLYCAVFFDKPNKPISVNKKWLLVAYDYDFNVWHKLYFDGIEQDHELKIIVTASYLIQDYFGRSVNVDWGTHDAWKWYVCEATTGKRNKSSRKKHKINVGNVLDKMYAIAYN